MLRHLPLIAVMLLLAACSNRQEKAAAAFESGNAMLAANNPDGALKDLKKATQLAEDNPQYWLVLARAQLQVGDFQSAYNAYSRVIELSPNDLEGLRAMAQLSLNGGALKDARRYADRLLALVPNDPNGLIVRAELEYRDRDFDAALGHAATVLEANDSLEPAVVIHAKTLFEMDRQEEAVAELENFTRRVGVRRMSMETLVTFYQRLRQGQKLAEALRRLSVVRPDSVGVKMRHARLLAALGRAKEAEAIVNAVEKTYRHDPDVMAAVVDYWRQTSGFSFARDVATRIGRDAEPSVALAMAAELIEDEEVRDAEPLLKPLLGGERIDAVNVQAQALYAEVELLRGERQAALDRATRVLDFDRTNARALIARAQVHLAEGAHEQALADAQLVLRDAPENSAAKILVARIYDAMGAEAVARQNFQEASNAFPRDERVLRRHIAFLLKRKDPTRALEVIAAYRGLNGDVPVVAMMTAELCRLSPRTCDLKPAA